MRGQKMHADEVCTDVRLAGRLLAAQFPQWADLSIQPVPRRGQITRYIGSATTWLCDSRIKWAVEGLDKEHRWLPRLPRCSRLPFRSRSTRGAP